MAKTIEELKESINNTINQNSSGQITGQGLNILLNEMADVLSTMGGNSGGSTTESGASGVYVVVADGFTIEDGTETLTLTKPENIKINKNAYNTIHESLKNKQGVSIYLSMKELYDFMRKAFEGVETGIPPYNQYGLSPYGIASMILNESNLEMTKEEFLQQMPEFEKYWGTEVYILDCDFGSLSLFNDGNIMAEQSSSPS